MGNNRMPKCACVTCNALGVYKLPVRKRGNGNAYLCSHHWNFMDDYSAENPVRLGTAKKNGFTFSIELETNRPTKKARMELCINGYRPTSDCTVGCEFKSPIYEGLNAVKAILPSIQDLLNDNDIEIGSNCGTHFHVGQREHINARNIECLGRFYHSLFVPLCESMKSNRDKTINIFGRDFGEWATTINSNSNAYNHTNFINLQHSYTIEYRLCKFVTCAQYALAVDMCKEFTRIIIDSFLIPYENMGSPSRAYTTQEQKDKLKRLAEKTGQKLVKAFENA